MKSTILTLITSFLLLIPASGQGQWEIVDLGIKSLKYDPADSWVVIDNFQDVQFIEQDIGFISAGFCGLHDVLGALYKTKDGGKNWNLTFKDFTQSISSFHFINESKGFKAGLVYNCVPSVFTTTSDSGYNWTEDTILGDVSDIFFLNDSIGWAGGERGIYKTIDGGENWNEGDRREEGIKSLFFFDEASGWAVTDRGRIIKYSIADGWKVFSIKSLPLNKVFFVDRDNGWIAGGYSNDDGLRPAFIRTVDGGNTWTNTAKPNYLINDFYFENKDHGWAVGEDRLEGGVILETINGGLDWDVVKDSLPVRLNALHFIDSIGWAVGDNGLVLTNDSNDSIKIKEEKINIDNESLFQNYPNPFQSRTTITYQIPVISHVELTIYDISGRRVATLVNGTREEDSYEVEWNTESMEAGIYFCELKGRQERQVIKMILID